MEKYLNACASADLNRFAAIQRASVAGQPPLVPMDLEIWFPTTQLIPWIKEEIEALPWTHPLVEGYLHRHPGYEPKVLLGLLTYGCVSGFRSSSQLARVCSSQCPFVKLTNGSRPFPSELIAFRRKNRRLVEHVVERLYRRAVLERFGADAFGRMPDLASELKRRASQRLDIARHLDASEE